MANISRFKSHIQCDVIHDNTSQQLIQITEDKLKLILTNHLTDIEKSKSWHLPVSLFATLFLVVITTNPKTIFGLSDSVWQAILVLACLATFFWAIASFIKTRNNSVLGLDELVEKIKTPRQS